MGLSISLPQRPCWSLLWCALTLAACGQGQSGNLTDDSAPDGESAFNPQEAILPGFSPFEDLSADTLIPPEQPTLSLSAESGVLNFHWYPVEAQTRARLYRYDPQLDGETLTHEFSDSTLGHWQLPSQTHRRAWHRQQYRIELCTVDDCVSSQRTSLFGLASETLDSFSPAVFIKGEQYAESIALNHDATLAILTLPVEGALEIRARIDRQWTLIQRLRLDALSVSASRTLDVAVSDSGDTLAVLVQDSNTATGDGIRILERLGEAWLETAAWPVQALATAEGQQGSQSSSIPETPDTNLTLSSNGDALLLFHNQTLVSFRRSDNGWSSVPQTMQASDTDQEAQTLAPALPTRLMASTPNADFTRLFTLAEENQLLYLGVWTPSADASRWQRRAHLPLQGLDLDRQLAISSNTAGSSVIAAGWEATGSQIRTPVMWRYEIEPASLEATAFELNVMDSLRAPPAGHAYPALIFSADATLSTVALGWHAVQVPASSSPELPDAALSTYVYDHQSRQWHSALELPENLPTLAKQSFAAQTILSADGMTMVMTGRIAPPDSDSSRMNQVLVMR